MPNLLRRVCNAEFLPYQNRLFFCCFRCKGRNSLVVAKEQPPICAKTKASNPCPVCCKFLLHECVRTEKPQLCPSSIIAILRQYEEFVSDFLHGNKSPSILKLSILPRCFCAQFIELDKEFRAQKNKAFFGFC